MTLDLVALREAYRAERPRYKELARYVAERLVAGLQVQGVKVAVEHRSKDVPNFLRKAIKKYREDPVQHADPLRSITDKAGVRVIIPHLQARKAVRETIEASFAVVEFNDTQDRYEPHELGYLGWHFLVTLPEVLVADELLELTGLLCEVQVQSKAQNAWSDVSHPLLYKPSGRLPPARTARRLNLAVALAEIFDEQVDSARRELTSAEGFRATAMYATLERHFLQMSYDDFDSELTLEILETIQHAYSNQELDSFDELFGEFIAYQRPVIEHIYTRYRHDPAAHPLLFQPEALAIYERLRVRPQKTKAVWRERSSYPTELLEQLGTVFGVG